MLKKRNKQNQNINQKVLEAQHRNDFYKRLSKFCMTLTGEDILSLIPTSERDSLYKRRPRTIAIVLEQGSTLPPQDYNNIKKLIYEWIKSTDIEMGINNQKVLMQDDYNFGIPLCSLVKESKKKNYKNAQKICDLLDDYFGSFVSIMDRFHDSFINGVFLYLTAALNDYTKNYYTFHMDLQKTSDNRITNQIIIKSYPAEKINVVLDKNVRPAFRMGWTFSDGFDWLALNPHK